MPRPFFATTALPVIQGPVLAVPQCHLCKLDKSCHTPKMPTSGKGRRRILVVAEAPGAEEDKQGIQLVGKSGQEAIKHFAMHGIDMRRDCWLENALICRPPNNKITNPKSVDYCRPNLLNRIKELNPEVIILFGGVAVQSLIGHLWSKNKNIGAMERWAGYQIPSQALNAWICPTFHPSYLLREGDPFLSNQFSQHIKAAVEHSGRPWKKIPKYKKRIDICLSSKRAAQVLSDIRDGVIAFDYETNMLKPDSPKGEIVSCSVCHNGKMTIAFPWHGKVLKQMARILKDPGIKKIACNAKFEHRWTAAKLDTEVRGWLWCTMHAAHVLENATKTRRITSIKFQAFVKLGFPDWSSSIEPYLKTDERSGYRMNRIKDVDLYTLLEYNGIDSLVEYLVAEKQIHSMGGEL